MAAEYVVKIILLAGAGARMKVIQISTEQAVYIGVIPEGSFKAEHYHY